MVNMIPDVFTVSVLFKAKSIND